MFQVDQTRPACPFRSLEKEPALPAKRLPHINIVTREEPQADDLMGDPSQFIYLFRRRAHRLDITPCDGSP